MSLQRFAFIARLSALVLTALALPARAVVTGYYVCVADVSTDGGKTSTTYASDVIPNTGFRPGHITGFREFLAATYHVNGFPRCFERETEAQARDFIKTTSPGVNKVLTGWTYSAGGTTTPAPASAKPAASPQTSSKIEPGSAPAPAGPLQGYCFEYAINKLFITKSFLYGRLNGDGVPQEFNAYVAKTYGAPPYASPRCATLHDSSRVESARQNEISDSKRSPSLQLVEFEWAPAQKIEPPAQAAAPATPAPNALDAYNKALAAQRPASNTPAQPAPAAAQPSSKASPAPVAAQTAPAQAPPSSPQAASTYSLCYAYGTPPASGGRAAKQHFYITRPFPVMSYANLNQSFESFLTGAHPGEKISASCLSPSPLAEAEQARQNTMTLRRKQTATFDVVEVDWKK